MVLPLTQQQSSLNINSETLQGRGTTNCFADDTNAACKQKTETLLAIKEILQDFAQISGLKV